MVFRGTKEKHQGNPQRKNIMVIPGDMREITPMTHHIGGKWGGMNAGKPQRKITVIRDIWGEVGVKASEESFFVIKNGVTRDRKKRTRDGTGGENLEVAVTGIILDQEVGKNILQYLKGDDPTHRWTTVFEVLPRERGKKKVY